MKGYAVVTVPPELAPILRRAVQGYMRSWAKYNPEEEIKKITVPVLIIQGSTDLQVNVKQAKKLKKARPDATLAIIDGMNHMLKDAPRDEAENIKTYANPKLPLSNGLTDAISGFVKGIKTHSAVSQ